jgi:predicted dehydrogenase
MLGTIGVGIVGAGSMGATHARAYARIPGVRVVTITGRSGTRAQVLAAEIGARAGMGIDAILADPAIHVVDVTVPTPQHSEFAVRGLEAGKHVIVEKPLALTLTEADAMLQAAQRAQRLLLVAHVLRFWPEYIAIHRLLDGAQVGRPLVAVASRLSNMPQWAPWFRDPTMSGGAVLDLHIHDLDMLNWLFGCPQKVYSTGVCDATGGWNHVVTLLEYPSARASAEASLLMPQGYPFTTALHVVCENGAVEYGFRAGGASFERGRPTSFLRVHQPGGIARDLPVEEGDAFVNELAYFTDCIRFGRQPETATAEDGRLALQVALAARASLESGTPITIAR